MIAPVSPAMPEFRVPDPKPTPIVVNLGRKRKTEIALLQQGRGALVQDVNEVLHHLDRELAGELGARPLVPIVIVVRERSKRSRTPALASFTRG